MKNTIEQKIREHYPKAETGSYVTEKYLSYPHIGISDEGELGKIIRPGQSALSNSCGALMLALNRLESDSEERLQINIKKHSKTLNNLIYE